MTLLSGSSQAEIDATIERCWAIVADVASAPSWQGGLQSLEVVQRDELGRALVCDTVTDARFTTVRCRVRVGYEPPRRLAMALVSSDDLDAMEASWELSELAGGRTLACYRLAVDPGAVGLLARPLERALRPLVVGSRPAELARAVAAAGAGSPSP
ncbi:MAG: type II toxin-antitoxin system RatA family toxin [Solirubrobacteraceae bacterium]